RVTSVVRFQTAMSKPFSAMFSASDAPMVPRPIRPISALTLPLLHFRAVPPNINRSCAAAPGATRRMAMRLLLRGVAGSGKTSVGQALAARIGIAYRDGDDLHPPANIAKMARGEPLTDEDRWPWLERVGQALAAEEALILGCSALKRAYR